MKRIVLFLSNAMMVLGITSLLVLKIDEMGFRAEDPLKKTKTHEGSKFS